MLRYSGKYVIVKNSCWKNTERYGLEMKKLLDMLTEEMQKAFEAAGYDSALGRVTVSNRPDLCEYQCNGAMAGAKQYKKAPIMIANEVAEKLADSRVFKEAAAVAPGFLNLKVSEKFLSDYAKGMKADARFGLDLPEHPKKIMIDYGGPNVAKALHVGHLRSAIIGESVKRIARYVGHEVIGDIILATGDSPWDSLFMNWSCVILTCLILRKVIQESIRRSLPLPLRSWRRYTLLPAQSQRRMQSTRKSYGSNLQAAERCERSPCPLESHYPCVRGRP